MSKNEFMTELEMLLSDISENEREEALKYYNDYFNDAGEEKEQSVINELGTPEQVAKTVKDGLSDTKVQNEFTENGIKNHTADMQKNEVVKSAEPSADNGTANQNDAAFNPNRKKSLPGWAIALIITGCLLAVSLVIGTVCVIRFVRFAKKTGNAAKHVIEEVVPKIDDGIEDEINKYLPKEIIDDNIQEIVENAFDEAIGDITNNNHDGKIQNTYQFDTADIRNLEVDFGLGSFVINEKDADDGVIDVNIIDSSGAECKINSNEDMTLVIKNDKNIVKLGKAGYNIDVAVPRGFKFDKAVFSFGACDAHINKLTANKAEIELGAGKVSYTNISVDNLEIEVGLGTAEVQGNIAKKLEAECGVGSIIFMLDGSETDHNYEIDCGMGAVKIGNFDVSGLAGEKYIENNTSSNYKVNCGMGSIVMTFTE